MLFGGRYFCVTFSKVAVTTVIGRLRLGLSKKQFGGVTRPRTSRLLVAKGKTGKRYELLLSTDTSLPLVCFASGGGPDPVATPGFYVLLHGRVKDTEISSVERPKVRHIIVFRLRRLGRLKSPYGGILVVRLVNGRDGVVFYSSGKVVLSDVGRISSRVDSIHRILPKERCFVPGARSGLSPLAIDRRRFYSIIYEGPYGISETICSSLAKVDPIITRRVYFETSVSKDSTTRSLSRTTEIRLCRAFHELVSRIIRKSFSPGVICQKRRPIRCNIFTFRRCKPRCRSIRFSDISRVLRACCTAGGALAHVRRGSSSLEEVIRATLRHGHGGLDLRRGRVGSATGGRGCGICKRLVGACKCKLRSKYGSFGTLGCCAGRRVAVPLSPAVAPTRGSGGCFSGCKGLGHARRTLARRVTSAEDRVRRLRSISGTLSVTLTRDSLTRVGRRLVRCKCVGGRCSHEGKRGTRDGSGPFRCIARSKCSVCIKGGGFRGSRLAFGFTAKGS